MIEPLLYGVLTVSLATGLTGLLTLRTEWAGAIRLLCGVILSLALLSPLKSLTALLSEQTEGSAGVEETQSGQQETKTALDRALAAKKAILEQALEEQLRTIGGEISLSVSLTVDGRDPSAVVIRGATVRFEGRPSEADMAEICARLSELVGCAVEMEVRDDRA